MLIRPQTSQTLTQCWYTRMHQPVTRKARGEGGMLLSVCRHCQRAIHSHGGKSWTLADGIDLDELASHSRIRYICVTSVDDGMIVARYPIDRDADEVAVQARIEEVIDRHEAKEPGSGLEVKLMGGPTR